MANPVSGESLGTWHSDATGNDSNNPVAASNAGTGQAQELAGNLRLIKSEVKGVVENLSWSKWLGERNLANSANIAFTYSSATIFTVNDNLVSRGVALVGRRVKALVTAGTIYGTITVAAWTSVTTVTVNWDGSGALDAGLTEVLFGIEANSVNVTMMPGSQNLTGANNSGTPNTKFDVLASYVVLRNPTTGQIATVVPSGTVTCDLDAAGPAANGRDQAGAFGATDLIQFYWIYNGTTLATIASTTTPAGGGPTMPTGYKFWAYIGAIKLAASALPVVRLRGRWFYYNPYKSVQVGGVSTTEAEIGLSNTVPATAHEVMVEVALYATGISSDGQDTLTLRFVTGSDFCKPLSIAATSLVSNIARGAVIVPQIGDQKVYYLITRSSSGGTVSMDLDVLGYSMPNGSC